MVYRRKKISHPINKLIKATRSLWFTKVSSPCFAFFSFLFLFISFIFWLSLRPWKLNNLIKCCVAALPLAATERWLPIAQWIGCVLFHKYIGLVALLFEWPEQKVCRCHTNNSRITKYVSVCESQRKEKKKEKRGAIPGIVDTLTTKRP